MNVDDSPPVERILAQDRLSGWGQPQGQVVPLYGQHWNPGAHRNLELVNVVTGEITTALKVEDVTQQYPDWFSKAYAGKEVSIFFPVLSPKLDRVFFKMASASGPDPRSGAASVRQGLICYDLQNQRFLYQNERWGHPSWHPDDRHIVETTFTIFDSDNGKSQRTPGLPVARGDHPSVSQMAACSSPIRRWTGLEATPTTGASSWPTHAVGSTSCSISFRTTRGPAPGGAPTPIRFSAQTAGASISTSAKAPGPACTWRRSGRHSLEAICRIRPWDDLAKFRAAPARLFCLPCSIEAQHGARFPP
ncbi:hypothetical protein [Verrucomicrobium spinosum]|uniref:hypothetical protein n=1 Tax=Verrucomicrobium spinosum TaxID=2736 RepID=UPI000A44AF55|nr:hypothetical protein [Verrucomicrobium spinosum]